MELRDTTRMCGARKIVLCAVMVCVVIGGCAVRAQDEASRWTLAKDSEAVVPDAKLRG
jgi:hypothetical protein